MNLTHPKGKVIVSVDLEGKNQHTMADGTTIRIEREYNNLNFREVYPVNGTVISAEHIPKGSTVLIHHNSTHDVNRFFDLGKLSGEEIANTTKYYSIPEEDCYLYKEQGSTAYKPCKGFATALRIYKPYEGTIEGIEPTLVKNKVYITSGEYEGLVCDVLVASMYEIVYQNDNNQEQRIGRIRHFENEEHPREEIVCIDKYTTKLVDEGKLLVGLSIKDAKKVK